MHYIALLLFTTISQAGTELIDLGNSGCHPGHLCGQCEGDCDSNDDCLPGLKCYQRHRSSDTVPGCTAGGSGDVSDHDYCYDPNSIGALWSRTDCEWYGRAPFCPFVDVCPDHLERLSSAQLLYTRFWSQADKNKYKYVYSFGADCMFGKKSWCCPKSPSNTLSESGVGTVSEHDKLKATNKALQDALRAVVAN